MRKITEKNDFRVEDKKLNSLQKNAFELFQESIKSKMGLPSKEEITNFLNAGFSPSQAVGVLISVGKGLIVNRNDFQLRLRLIQSILFSNA